MKRIGVDTRKIDDFGIGTYIAGLLTQFAEQDHTHHYVLFGNVDRLRARFGDRFELVPAAAGKYSLREQAELPSLIRAARLDLFHSPHYTVPVFSTCPLVATVHDLIHLRLDLRPGFKNWLASLYARALVGRAVRQARRVIVVSKATQLDVEGFFPAARGKTAMIYNGAETSLGKQVDPGGLAEFRQRHGLTHPLLLFAGNPKPHKNVPMVLDTVAELRRRGRPVQLAMAGSRPEAVCELARAHGVADAVVALGYLPEKELTFVYHASDLLLFPSLCEGFGLPVLEAMAAGLPVVTSNVSSLPEVAGDAAITTDPRDSRALADAVIRVLDEPGLREQLIERGLRRATQFSWRQCAEAHLALYEEVLRAC